MPRPLSAPIPSASPPPAPRARRPRSSPFVRNMFRHFRRSRPAPTPTPPPPPPTRPPSPPPRSHLSTSDHQLKPIYIYPGLLRIVRDKAIALDNQCPAVLYKCRDCRRARDKPLANHSTSESTAESVAESVADPCAAPDADADASIPNLLPAPNTSVNTPDSHPQPQVSQCPHQTTCPICLDEFHDKDLVRKLPCNINHVFHSKCILDWFVSHHRCPLCNEVVTPTPTASSSILATTSSASTTTGTQTASPTSSRNDPSVRFHARAPSDFMRESRRARSQRVHSRQRSDAGLLDRLRRSRTAPGSEDGRRDQAATPERQPSPPVRSSSSSTSSLLSSGGVRSHTQRSLPQRPMSMPPSLSRNSTRATMLPAARSDALRQFVQPFLYEERDGLSEPARDLDGRAEGNVQEDESSCRDGAFSHRSDKTVGSADKSKKKSRGPRTYSYIVHDNVRMEMNPVIPV